MIQYTYQITKGFIMNINAYKEYRFAFGKLVATDTGKEYSFSISRKDRFYHYMEEHIKKEKVDSLTHETIDNISIEDADKTFFDEKSFILNTIMLVTDRNDNVNSYMLTMKNIKITPKDISKKRYDNNSWKLEMYDLEIPWQTNIDIAEVQD